MIALLVAVVTAVAGCSRQEDAATPAATLGEAPAATVAPTAEPTPSETLDPYAIPDDPADIDEAYVERVLEALTSPIAQATRAVVRNGRLTASARATLARTHRGQALAGTVVAYQSALKKAPANQIFNGDARPVSVEVQRIIGASKQCIFVMAWQDTSGLAKQEIEPFATYFELGRKQAADDPAGHNPTPWMIVVDALPRRDGKEYRNPCG